MAFSAKAEQEKADRRLAMQLDFQDPNGMVSNELSVMHVSSSADKYNIMWFFEPKELPAVLPHFHKLVMLPDGPLARGHPEGQMSSLPIGDVA